MEPLGPLTHLGRYRLLRPLGRGAMGMVFEAHDPRLDRTVAIKTILKSHLLDETLAADYSARFMREAQAVARLDHPNIVRLYDFGDESEVAYIVMEFVRGRELAQAFAAGERFDLPTVVRLMDELLEALAFAHERGVVHRDIKPANVMIDADGHVKLTDFGVARLVDSNVDRTQPGTMVGTPSWMSPEQILGLAVGSRADLFAAGVVLYQFLTGDKPFKGKGAWEVQHKIVHEAATPPSHLNPDLPAAFDTVVARALAKRPEDRPATAGDLAVDLRRALAEAQRLRPDVGRGREAGAPQAPVHMAPADPVDLDLSLEAEPSPAGPLHGGEASGRDASSGVVAARSGWRGPVVAGVAALVCAAGALGWFLLRPVASRPPPTAASAPMTPASPLPAQDGAARMRPESAPQASDDGPTAAAPSASASVTASAAASAPQVVAAPPAARGPAAPSAAMPATPRAQPSSAAPRTDPGPPRRGGSLDARCADLLQRAQLGEVLSSDQLAVLRKECMP